MDELRSDRGQTLRNHASDRDAAHDGKLALIVVELGLITPPVGLNVFIISGLAKDVPMLETFRGVMPFFTAEIFAWH